MSVTDKLTDKKDVPKLKVVGLSDPLIIVESFGRLANNLEKLIFLF